MLKSEESLSNLYKKLLVLDVENFIENIYTNQKFLDCRESVVINMSKYEIIEDTIFLCRKYRSFFKLQKTKKISKLKSIQKQLFFSNFKV